jgi:hypothetical protein
MDMGPANLTGAASASELPERGRFGRGEADRGRGGAGGRAPYVPGRQVSGGSRAPCAHLARWWVASTVGRGVRVPAVAGHGRSAWALDARRPPLAQGALGRSGRPAVSSMRWSGAEPPIGAADQAPATLMDGPMVGPAQQGQVREVGRATIDPVLQMMRVTPGQGPLTAREDTAAVADGQGGPLGGVDDPGGPADVQGLTGRPAQHRRQQGHGRA